MMISEVLRQYVLILVKAVPLDKNNPKDVKELERLTEKYKKYKEMIDDFEMRVEDLEKGMKNE